jgi:hypothetical protein
VKESYEIHSLDTRIALEEGDLARAVQAFGRVGAQSPTYSVARLGFHLALELRIRLNEAADGDVLLAIVRDLEVAHLQLRRIGSQDFECYSLYLGLCALGRPEHAVRLLEEYVDQRRIRWPLPKVILEALGHPVFTPSSSGTNATAG